MRKNILLGLEENDLAKLDFIIGMFCATNKRSITTSAYFRHLIRREHLDRMKNPIDDTISKTNI